MSDLRAQRRIDKLEGEIARLQIVVATLIDAQKYHLRGSLDTATEKNRDAQDRFLKSIRQENGEKILKAIKER